MNATALIEQVHAAGGEIRAEGDRLKLKAPAPLPPELVQEIKEHKAEVLAALSVSVRKQSADLLEAFEERAGILEHDGGLTRSQAEQEAARMVATLARNKGYAWATLRKALSEYPSILEQIPDKPGPVDALPLGVPKVAILPNRKVIPQGRRSA